MTLRVAQLDDAAHLLAVERACFPDPWNEKSVHDAISGTHNFAVVAEDAGQIVGYGAGWTLFDEGEITRVAVLPAMRGQGLGELLSRTLLQMCHKRGARQTFLEVRAGNEVAQRLYARVGFAVCGTRRRYYADGEDAVMMRIEAR